MRNIISFRLMGLIVSAQVTIDLQDVFDNLQTFRKRAFIGNNIIHATDDVLIQELVNRGYEISKG